MVGCSFEGTIFFCQSGDQVQGLILVGRVSELYKFPGAHFSAPLPTFFKGFIFSYDRLQGVNFCNGS